MSEIRENDKAKRLGAKSADSKSEKSSEKDGEKKFSSFRKRERPPVDMILDYKDVETLRSFISEGGRIVPSRVNRLNRTQQRDITAQIKRARQLALLPMSDRHTSAIKS